MYAVFRSGGKQHRVTKGQTLRLEKLDAKSGSTLEFNSVLLVSNSSEGITIGTPIIQGAKVFAEVLQHGRDNKIKIVKFRRRKHSRKQQGHRQWFTEVKITDID
ncbi:50S ribosomal protein L21 [Candidatus Photodesmus katoptron]|uniref:Large ribosomal subunit protein bL21 n=1 Tax=Candidatus Photodesmus katoptron Akat1 TaxID=1236703 RepID=S3DZC5_9GAMM|nr:50S ribosomal protein L21 [Candidatus Photodesmus katoptron]EPE37266.1 ribosomal protein L21 [Candidatus Photodesmus katoptron Akat1]KEY90077.1 50S ribosomal protein L21 [Candidatus Photodesmus katoptron]